MKRRFTYKELSLVLGIIVAVIIWLTLRFTNAPITASPATTRLKPSGKTSEVIHHFIRRAVSQIKL
ncbi:MAG TPA: hypothetical protein VIM65_15965 [Cyclobacteriaceae bacterium]